MIILDDLDEKEKNDPWIPAMFKISRHKTFICFQKQSRFLGIAKTHFQSQWKCISYIQTKQSRNFQNPFLRQSIHRYDPTAI